MSIKQYDGGGVGAGRLCKGEDYIAYSLYNFTQYTAPIFLNILKMASYSNSIDVLSVPCSRSSILFLSDADASPNDSSGIGRESEPFHSNSGRFFSPASGQAFCDLADKGRRYAD